MSKSKLKQTVDATSFQPSIDISNLAGASPGCAQDWYGHAFEDGFRATVLVLRRKGADLELADDLAQAAWARGWERLGQLNDRSSVVEWVTSIGVRMFWDEFTKSRRIAPLLPAGSELRVAPAVNLTAIDIDRILDRPRQRELVKAVYREGKTAEEVAESLGISVGAVHHRLSRLRAELRRRLGAS